MTRSRERMEPNAVEITRRPSYLRRLAGSLREMGSRVSSLGAKVLIESIRAESGRGIDGKSGERLMEMANQAKDERIALSALSELSGMMTELAYITISSKHKSVREKAGEMLRET